MGEQINAPESYGEKTYSVQGCQEFVDETVSSVVWKVNKESSLKLESVDTMRMLSPSDSWDGCAGQECEASGNTTGSDIVLDKYIDML